MSDTHKSPLWGFLQLLGVCTGFVALRMITKFPAYINKYSGSGLIPYYAGLLVVLLPIIYVQMRLGGSTHRNVVSLFSKTCPILKGIGVASIVRLFIINIFFNVYMAYTIYYGFSSLTEPYPWARCDANWSSSNCDNSSNAFMEGHVPSEVEFFEDHVLEISSGVSDEGDIPWHLAVCLLSAWLITYLCIFAGMRWFAIVMSFCGLASTVIAMALLAYGREEASHGHPESQLYSPDWATITEPSIVSSFLQSWMDGVLEATLIAKAWDGILPTLGKYSGKLKRHTHTSWIIVLLVLAVMPHLFLNLIAAYMGALMEHAPNLALNETLHAEHHMLFVYFPAAFQLLDFKRGVVFVFYFMIFLFGISAQALWSSVAVDNIVDGLKHSLKLCGGRKFVLFILVAALYCAAGLVLGLPLVTQGGLYLVIFVEKWVDKLLCFYIFFNFLAFTVAYAKQDYHIVNKIIFILWFVLASLLVTVVTIYKADFHNEDSRGFKFTADVKYKQEFEYPLWAYILGWFVAGGPVLIGLMFGAMHAVAAAPGKACCSKLVNACMGVDPASRRSSRKGKRTSSSMDNSDYPNGNY